MYLAKLAVSLFALSTAFAAAVPAQIQKRADLRAFDVSQPQAGYRSDFWACAHSAGYGKAVIRAYQQACGSVGRLTIVRMIVF